MTFVVHHEIPCSASVEIRLCVRYLTRPQIEFFLPDFLDMKVGDERDELLFGEAERNSEELYKLRV